MTAPVTKVEQKEITRGEIEVLILVTGLILTPVFYLWQTAISNLQSIVEPAWQTYLNTHLGPNYSFNGEIAIYFSPFGLLRVLPIDMLLWLYDTIIILSTVTIVIFGVALIAVERTDAKQVQLVVLRGRRLLTAVLMLMIFFAIEHVLRFTILPYRLLLGPFDSWTVILTAAVSTIILYSRLNGYFKRILGPQWGM